MRTLLVICTILILSAAHGSASPRVKVLKLSVTNPTDQARLAEDVVVSVAELKRIAPDFRASDVIVTTSDATTLPEDSRTLQTIELPSQADDLDGDNKFDELAFQIDLKPRQTRVVTISYGDTATIQRLRSDYPKRTAAKFTMKFDGLGWESETTAWRIYFDKRNAIDIWGKRRPGLYLEMFGSPEYVYHWESPFGRDIYRIGDAIGIGAVAASVDGKTVRVEDVAERKWRIISAGPVRVIVEGADGLTLVTGIVRQPGLQAPELPPSGAEPVNGDSRFVYASLWWGPQVVEEGPSATAIHMLPDQNLGLAIIARGKASKPIPDDPLNLLVQPLFENGRAEWYVTGVWDQENTDNLSVSATSADSRIRYGTLAAPRQSPRTLDQFVSFVQEAQARFTWPATISILSARAASQSAPVDTLQPARKKSYTEAIDLLKQSAERTAQKLEPAISRTNPADAARDAGEGFFTEGDNQTGEWKPQKGFYWTGSFWVGELWQLDARTRDEPF